MLHPPPSPVFWFSFKFHSPVACKADSAVACSAFSVCVPKKWEIQHGYDFIIMLYEMPVYTDNQSCFFLSQHPFQSITCSTGQALSPLGISKFKLPGEFVYCTCKQEKGK